MDTDGTDRRNVSRLPAANNTNPAWSPNGRRLAFVSDRGGNMDVFVMGSTGAGRPT
jgi:TolB protein